MECLALCANITIRESSFDLRPELSCQCHMSLNASLFGPEGIQDINRLAE